MSLLRSLLTAFSMFSRLPVPTLKWNEGNMRYLLVMFPLVGIAVGQAARPPNESARSSRTRTPARLPSSARRLTCSYISASPASCRTSRKRRCFCF